LIGGSGNDDLRGGSGADVLDAIDGSGGDIVRGGSGFDICYLESSDTSSGCERRVVA
jgi:Ca2+-binding RTX toxin-like protein